MWRNKYKIRVVRRNDDGIKAFERAVYDEDEKRMDEDEEESLIRSTATREKEKVSGNFDAFRGFWIMGM